MRSEYFGLVVFLVALAIWFYPKETGEKIHQFISAVQGQ